MQDAYLTHRDLFSDGIELGDVFNCHRQCLLPETAVLSVGGLCYQIKCFHGGELEISAFYFLKKIIWFFYLKIIYVQGLVLVLLLGKLIGKIFFGQLRTAEVEVNWTV